MGKGKGGKGKNGKDHEGNKGSKGWGHSQLATTPLLAPQHAALACACQEVSGGLHAFDGGHILFSSKEFYFELRGQCSVHLAVPAPTKISSSDREAFANSGPVQLAGRHFRNLQELRSEIISLRKAHSNPPRRLRPEAEQLMRSVFQHHPQAQEKLRDLEFIQVAPNAQSADPTDVTFFVMRNEQDGDDISYVKCLRAMAEQREGEQMLPLATLKRDQRGLALRVAQGWEQLVPSPGGGLGVRVDLAAPSLFVHSAAGLRGPWQLQLSREHSGLPHVPLRVVLDVPDAESVVLRWAAPFEFKDAPGPSAWLEPPSELALPALEDQGLKPGDLKKCLEALMKDQGIPGDLSSLSEAELLRIGLQVLVKSLDASLHVTRSDGACAAQNQSLLRIAREQGIELTCQQLQEARKELQSLKAERDAMEATLRQLREEMAATLRRHKHEDAGEAGGSALAVQDVGTSTGINGSHGATAAEEELDQLRRELQKELPDPAGTMLRNSLKLMSSEMYSGPSRALWELLQNADDCTYAEDAKMEFQKLGDDLWIEYNEEGFTSEDVKALCSLGSSTKTKAEQQTGEKGVGFKSAFVLSSRPHILSNPYRFFFDEASACPLPQVTPHRLGAGCALPRRAPQRGTALYLPLRKDFPKLLDEIVPEALLFLHRLRCITVGQQIFMRRDGEDGHCKLLVENASGTKEEHEYIIARDTGGVAVAFPLGECRGGTTGGPALLMATLPIHSLEGLKTPLNAPFELTANREALRENSDRNLKLRDALAELFLRAAEEHPILSSHVWQLQPDADAGGFWAPFVHRVRAGLQEVPLIPARGTTSRQALKQCRRPDSPLLWELDLQPSDLEMMGLALPTDEFLRQLPSGSSFNLPEFDAKDLLGLLQSDAPWRGYGNPWRQKVVGAFLRRLSQVESMQVLRSVALFPVGDGEEWSACEEAQIFVSLPDGAPPGLLKVLHEPSACCEDRDLLKSMGSGFAATARDVAYAIVQRALGLATVEDRRFSWTNLAYLGQSWQNILDSGAADDWLSKQTPQQMQELMRSVALPSCSGRLLSCAQELQCPFLLGCKSVASDRSKLLAEPPGANDVEARLRWELVFLRLGARRAQEELRLPRDFFAEPGMGKELEPLLDHYEQLGDLPKIQKRCSIVDLAGRSCRFGQPLSPSFQPMLGPDRVLDICADDTVARCAERLVGVVLKPTAVLVARGLANAARGGPDTLRCAYEFLSGEWRRGCLDDEAVGLLKTSGIWMLNCDGELSLEQVTDITWEDVQRQVSLWPKDGLEGVFHALGVAAAPASPASATAVPAATVPPAAAAVAAAQGPGPFSQQQRTSASTSGQPVRWPALPQVRAMPDDGNPGEPAVLGAGSGASRPFPEIAGAQLPLLGKLLERIFHSVGGEQVVYGQSSRKELLVSEIHFTQNSISTKFGHGALRGRKVSDVAQALRDGQMKSADLPLAVVKFESKYFTLNNRSLFALRKASTAQQPLKAQVTTFERLCPATAKFIQLRCSSLEEEPAEDRR